MFLPQSVYTMISWSMPAYCATETINFDKMPVRGHYTISMCIQLSYSSSFLGQTPWYNALRLAKSQCHGHWAWFPACILCLQLVNQSARKQVICRGSMLWLIRWNTAGHSSSLTSPLHDLGLDIGYGVQHTCKVLGFEENTHRQAP